MHRIPAPDIGIYYNKAMRKATDWDADTLYLQLEKIGVDMRKLDKCDPTVEYLRELYGFLLHMQLLAWKSGNNHTGVIRATNDAISHKRPIFRTIGKRK